MDFFFLVSTYLGLLSEVVEGVPSDTSKDHETVRTFLIWGLVLWAFFPVPSDFDLDMQL